VGVISVDMNNDDPLRNVEDSALFLGLKPATVRKWILERRLPFVKIGRSVRIRQSTLAAIVERSTIPAIERRA
jgi:excisionase family DNA binding protein